MVAHRAVLSELLVRRRPSVARADVRRVALAAVVLLVIAGVWRPVRAALIRSVARTSVGLPDRTDFLLAELRRELRDAIPPHVTYWLDKPEEYAWAIATGGAGANGFIAWLDAPQRPLDTSVSVVIADADFEVLGRLRAPGLWNICDVADLDGDGAPEACLQWWLDWRQWPTPYMYAVVRLRPDHNELVGAMLVDLGPRTRANWYEVALVDDGSQKAPAVSPFVRSPSTIRSMGRLDHSNPLFRMRWDRPGGVLIADGGSAPELVQFWRAEAGPERLEPGASLSDEVLRRIPGAGQFASVKSSHAGVAASASGPAAQPP